MRNLRSVVFCFTTSVFLLGTLLQSAVVGAAAEAWQATFSPASTGSEFLPGDPLRVGLPPDIDSETLQWLALELDNIDVTQIVSLEGMDAVVRPPQPLGPGEHVLRLLQYSPDGRLTERGVWSFSVRNVATYQFVSEVSFNANYRAASGDIPEEQFPEHRTTGDGGARFQGMVGKDDWKVSGSLDMIYNSEPGAMLNELEGGDFLIEAAKGPVTLDLGHHSMGPDSLVMDNFHRRGASLSFRSAAEAVAASGFAFRSEPVSGFRDGFGVSDEDNRVAGGIITARPIPGKGDLLSISATYLYGEQGTEPGQAVIDDQAAGEGNAWSVAAESLTWGQKFRLRGEYAATVFDNDGGGLVEEKVSDDALALSAVFVPVMNALYREKPLYWDIGAEYQKVGTYFHSIANPGLPSDLEMVRGYTTMNWSGLSVEGVLGREKDNVNGQEFLPTSRTDFISLSSTYLFFADAPETSGRRRWLGQPTFNIGAQQAWDKTEDVPDDYGGGEVDFRSRDFYLSLGSSYASWDWYAGHNRSWQDDFSGQISDTRSDVTDLSANWRPGERFAFGARGQLNKIREEATGLEFEGNLAAVDAFVVIIKDRVTARASYQIDLQEANDGTTDDRTETTDFNVEWAVRQARKNIPGLSVWVRGQYQEIDDRTGFIADSYPFQVFTGFTIGWPYSYPAVY